MAEVVSLEFAMRPWFDLVGRRWRGGDQWGCCVSDEGEKG